MSNTEPREQGAVLAPFAARAGEGERRLFAEPDAPPRGAFRRDRDRIVHAQAFRRLAHKTQVFMSEEGDHYRTRLTHTIEVAQIARSIARDLGLDSDLTEALALAHDLGHPPFGHTGEDALADSMAGFGGFDHNAQTLRIVTRLEQRYATFDGLNLTRETLDGIIKHNGPLACEPSALPFALRDFLGTREALELDWQLSRHASLEAQVAALSDDIAYTAHDIDDGVRAGVFTLDDLKHVTTLRSLLDAVDMAHPGLAEERRRGEVIRRLITRLIVDVEETTRAELDRLAPSSPDAIKDAGRTLVRFSDPVAEDVWLVKAFLFKTMYRNSRLMALRAAAGQVLADLFNLYMRAPDRLPAGWSVTGEDRSDEERLARRVCDFIAGMTDRYALALHARLFDATPDLRYGASV